MNACANVTIIKEDDFFDNWGVIYAETGDYFEFDEVMGAKLECVWTIVEAENDMYALSGFHIVNKLGYILTKREWVTGMEKAEFYISDDEK